MGTGSYPAENRNTAGWQLASAVYGLISGGGVALVALVVLSLADQPCAEAKANEFLNKIGSHVSASAPPAYCDYMGGFEADPSSWISGAGIVVGLIVGFFAYFVGWARHRP